MGSALGCGAASPGHAPCQRQRLQPKAELAKDGTPRGHRVRLRTTRTRVSQAQGMARSFPPV